MKKENAANPTGIVCTGCGRDASTCTEYTDETPVTQDGTYAAKRFVCTACYCQLITLGRDLGTAWAIQANAAQYLRKKRGTP